MEEKIVKLQINGKEYKIYALSFLEALKFTQHQIDEFIETDVLYNSFCVGVVRELAYEHSQEFMSVEDALNLMSSDERWFMNVFWTALERVDFEKRFVRIMMKVLGLDIDEAWHEAEVWSGFGAVPQLISTENWYYEKYMRLHDEARKEMKAVAELKKAKARKRKTKKS